MKTKTEQATKTLETLKNNPIFRNNVKVLAIDNDSESILLVLLNSKVAFQMVTELNRVLTSLGGNYEKSNTDNSAELVISVI